MHNTQREGQAPDIAAIAQQCEGAHRDTQGWRARCPVHQGKSDTSLHIWEENGALRIYCHAGCDVKDLLAKLNIERQRTAKEPSAIYSYHDELGNLLFQVCRVPPKNFFQRRPDPAKPGKWVNSLGNITPVLYRLPEIIRAKEAGLPIYLVEGEKDVETLRSYGLIATSNPMGAGKWHDSYSEALRGARIILFTDNDKPGKKHGELLTSRLTGYAKSLTWVDLPGLEEHGDITDWMTLHSLDDLHALTKNAPSTIETPHLVMTPLDHIEREVVEWLWEPYIPLGKLTFLEGDPGNGKTFLALAIATALSKGFTLPDQDGILADTDLTPQNTLYITAEDGLGDTIRPRAEDMGADLSRIIAVKGWSAGTELHPFNFQQINLLQEAIRDADIKLVIIDPIDAFLGADVDMYRPNEVRPVMSQIHLIAQATKCAVVFIRHWTKGGNGNARYRGLGSIAFTASVRSMLCVGEALDDENKRIMAQSKTNVGPMGHSQVFSVKDGIFGWYGVSDIDAETLAQQQPRKRQHQMRSAVDWLKTLLRAGPIAATTIVTLAEAEDISEKTLRRAKQQLGILSDKERGAWYWKLPSTQDDPPF